MRLETMRADLQGGEGSSAALLGAYRGRCLVGAVFFQLQAGRSGILGLPVVLSDEPAETPRSLLGAAARRLAGEDARLIYAILEKETDAEVDLLRQTGFKHLAHLLYLVAPESEFPRRPPGMPARFRALCAGQSPAVGKSCGSDLPADDGLSGPGNGPRRGRCSGGLSPDGRVRCEPLADRARRRRRRRLLAPDRSSATPESGAGLHGGGACGRGASDGAIRSPGTRNGRRTRLDDGGSCWPLTRPTCPP